MTKLSVKTIKFFRNSKLYLANTQERIFTRQERICTRGGGRGLISSSLLFWVLITMLSCHPGAAGSSVSPAGPSSASASQEPTIASQEDHVKDDKNAETLKCYYDVIQDNFESSSVDTEKVVTLFSPLYFYGFELSNLLLEALDRDGHSNWISQWYKIMSAFIYSCKNEELQKTFQDWKKQCITKGCQFLVNIEKDTLAEMRPEELDVIINRYMNLLEYSEREFSPFRRASAGYSQLYTTFEIVCMRPLVGICMGRHFQDTDEHQSLLTQCSFETTSRFTPQFTFETLRSFTLELEHWFKTHKAKTDIFSKFIGIQQSVVGKITMRPEMLERLNLQHAHNGLQEKISAHGYCDSDNDDVVVVDSGNPESEIRDRYSASSDHMKMMELIYIMESIVSPLRNVFDQKFREIALYEIFEILEPGLTNRSPNPITVNWFYDEIQDKFVLKNRDNNSVKQVLFTEYNKVGETFFSYWIECLASDSVDFLTFWKNAKKILKTANLPSCGPEFILAKTHPGSSNHDPDNPGACRACHFAVGKCWKGMDCSFCHICPKPKRKSKHQRDVEKRRQNNYEILKQKSGPECLSLVLQVDVIRRSVMSCSEEFIALIKRCFEDQPDNHTETLEKIKKMISDQQTFIEKTKHDIASLAASDSSKEVPQSSSCASAAAELMLSPSPVSHDRFFENSNGFPQGQYHQDFGQGQNPLPVLEQDLYTQDFGQGQYLQGCREDQYRQGLGNGQYPPSLEQYSYHQDFGQGQYLQGCREDQYRQGLGNGQYPPSLEQYSYHQDFGQGQHSLSDLEQELYLQGFGKGQYKKGFWEDPYRQSFGKGKYRKGFGKGKYRKGFGQGLLSNPAFQNACYKL